jgi:hypothetical protein
VTTFSTVSWYERPPTRVSGRYTWSVANTGKAKLFIDGNLVIDNTDWTGVGLPYKGFRDIAVAEEINQ